MLDLSEDFPLLKRRIDGQPIVYFDSAATTLKPACVIDAENHYNSFMTANIHRGKHTLSEEASQAYEDARTDVASFLNTKAANIVFVKNATEGLNTLANGLGLNKQDKILIPLSEHHSNIVPWMRSADPVFFEGDPCNSIDPQELKAALEYHCPKVVTFSAMSNVTGTINPIRELSKIAREYGVISVVDASQWVGHFPTDVNEIGCDYLVFSGHKMLGPTGIGVLYGTEEGLNQLSPLVLGGGCIERVTLDGYSLKKPPYRFEAGTPPIASAIGLAAAIKYLNRIGFTEIQNHEQLLAEKLTGIFKNLLNHTGVYVNVSSEIALASFSLTNVPLHPDAISTALSENYKIMTRSGHHCAHPLFDAIKLQLGSVRVSAYIYNTIVEIEYFDEAISNIAKRFSIAA